DGHDFAARDHHVDSGEDGAAVVGEADVGDLYEILLFFLHRRDAAKSVNSKPVPTREPPTALPLERALKIVVTAAASRLARVVLPLVCGTAAIAEVVAIDSTPVPFADAKLAPVQGDIRDERTHAALEGAHALVHLGPSGAATDAGEDALFEANVRAPHKLFHAARARGVKRLVHVSTAAVYGTAIHAGEDAPLKP